MGQIGTFKAPGNDLYSAGDHDARVPGRAVSTLSR
jgi:hypothetical protein